MIKLSDVGEYGIHDRIFELLRVDPGLSGPGDDACVIPLTKTTGVAICTDIVPSGLSGFYAGRFAVIHNFSDLLSVGATPKGILLAVCAPADSDLSDFDALISGANEEANKYHASVLGGDTKERRQYSVVGTGVGLVNPEQSVSRSKAKTGDIVAVTLTGQRGWGRRWAYVLCQSLLGDQTDITGLLRPFYESDLWLPYNEMIALAGNRLVSAGMDCSDGLLASCYLLSHASNVCIELEIDRLMGLLAPETVSAAHALGLPPTAFAFTPGYDWECILTIRESLFAQAVTTVESVGGKMLQVGRVKDGRGVECYYGGHQVTVPVIGDIKFSKTQQFNSPEEWVDFAKLFWGL